MMIRTYLKAARKLLRHVPYLFKEELLFRQHSEIMIQDRKLFLQNTIGLKVLVVSKFFTRNFGDRLGFHNISVLTSLVPNIASIDFDDLETLKKNPANYDVVIVGTGNSLSAQMITQDFIEYLSNAKKVIGIFGFQYYEELENNREIFTKCISLFEKIFIRYEQDINFLMKLDIDTSHITHFGDWLILLFPLVGWSKDETLFITHKEPFIRNALDLYIQDIQTYRKVQSNRLHTLLCALCSAEEVAFGEQYNSKKDMISGKFRGLIEDVFMDEIPIGQFFIVDKAKVQSYRNQVSKNFLNLVAYLQEIK